VRLDDDAGLSVFDLDKELLLTCGFGPSLSQFVSLLAVRHLEGNARVLESRALPVDELCRLLALRPDTVRRYAKRVNQTLKKAAAEHDHHVGDLVQDKSADDPAIRAWYLNVDLVVVAPTVVHAIHKLRGTGQLIVPSADVEDTLAADRPSRRRSTN